MENWWIALFEELGLITREQADHIATEIKNSVGRANYREAVTELHSIVERSKFAGKPVVADLDSRLHDLEARFLTEHATAIKALGDKLELLQAQLSALSDELDKHQPAAPQKRLAKAKQAA